MQSSHSYFLLPWLPPSVAGVGDWKQTKLASVKYQCLFPNQGEILFLSEWRRTLGIWNCLVNFDLWAWQPLHLFPLLCLIKAEWSCQLVYNVVFRCTKKIPLVPEVLLAQEFLNAIRGWVLFLEYSSNPGTFTFSPNDLKDKLELCCRPSEHENFWGFHKCNMRKLF